MKDDAAELQGRAAVLEQWEVAFRAPPPAHLSLGFMQNAIAYDAQCRRAGGLPAATRRALEQIALGRPARDIASDPAKPGTHYVREWNGRTYQVVATKEGFVMDGRIWPSLSAIAKHITGTTWSGPRFFGLSRMRATPVSASP